MPNADTIRQTAREVVYQMIGGPVKDDEPLISSGRIDSLSVLRLIARLETQLGTRIPSQQLQPDDFESIDWITDTILRVTGEA